MKSVNTIERFCSLSDVIAHLDKTGVDLNSALADRFKNSLQENMHKLTAPREVASLTKACLVTKTALTNELVDNYIRNVPTMHFDPKLARQLLESTDGEQSNRLLDAFINSKLVSPEGLSESQILERIELCNLVFSLRKSDVWNDKAFLEIVYYQCFKVNMSLTFFRLKNVLEFLNHLPELGIADADFWLKSEDYIIR